jgi:hypothetical protein
MPERDGILLIQWNGSHYDSLAGLLQLAGQEFAGQGFAVRTVTMDRPGWKDELATLLRAEPPLCAIGMSGVGSDLQTAQRKSLWEAAKVPFFDWNCDHPAYFPRRHAIRSRYLLHGYVFPDHAQYSIRHFNANGVAFCAHLGVPPRSIFEGAPRPLAARNGRIVFAKTGADTNAIEARWRRLSPILRDLLFAASEELFHRSTAEHLPTLQRLGETRGFLLDGSGLLALRLIRELDAYIRHRRARMVLEAVRTCPVDVYGAGWEHVDQETGQVRFHGPAEWRTLTGLLPGYLGCLTINPLVEHSVHDRSFFALAANVTPLGDSNIFSRAQLPALEGFTFRFDPASVRAAVETLFADPAAAMALTEQAWLQVRERFSLRASLGLILDAAQMVPLNARASA